MPDPEPHLLGIEAGGTRTIAILAEGRHRLIHRLEIGSANLRLLSDAQLKERLRTLHHRFPKPDALGIGLAGARDSEDIRRVKNVAAHLWKGVPVRISHDLETAWQAASINPSLRGKRPSAALPSIIVLSGTGSCCYGKNSAGIVRRVGGWGHLLGDRGSAFQIGLLALRDACVAPWDRRQKWGGFGRFVMERLHLVRPDDLISWVQNASKTDVAALAPLVFAAARAGDDAAQQVIRSCAESLGHDAVACARFLAGNGRSVRFSYTGGVLRNQSGFRRLVTAVIRELRPNLSDRFEVLDKETVWGAVEMAHQAWEEGQRNDETPSRQRDTAQSSEKNSVMEHARGRFRPGSGRLSPTEERNPRTRRLDKVSIIAAVHLLLREESRVVPAIRAASPQIAKVIEWVGEAFRHQGRLLYVGSGTSGRLGVLDATECPPTFRTPAEMVQGIVAGGARALTTAVEGAEDDYEAGITAIRLRKAGKQDVVIGIAASGRTPFVWGALEEAHRRGARSVLLCCNPFLELSEQNRPDLVIALRTGPEALTGSTRLKAGTATKIVLNLISTLSMVRAGKVVSNMMVDLSATNTKLRERAIRIVREISRATHLRAEKVLKESGWNVRKAISRLK